MRGFGKGHALKMFSSIKFKMTSLAAILDYNMCNIWFLRGLCPEKFQQNYILNGRLALIFNPPFNLKRWAIAIEGDQPRLW